MKPLPLVLALLALSVPASSLAEVQEAKEGSFATQSVVMVDLKPEAAYRAFLRVAAWWDPSHTWSGSAKNLSLDPRAGGCFCEKLADGGSVEHARVVFVQPNALLRLNGALGPLQEMAVTGVLTFSFMPDGPGTRITMTYRVSGQLSMESAKLASVVDDVLGSQLQRLRNFANPQAAR